MLWYGSAPAMEEGLLARLAEEPDVRRVVLRCGGLGRIDLTGAYTLAEMLDHAERAGLEMTLEDAPARALTILGAVGVRDSGQGGT